MHRNVLDRYRIIARLGRGGMADVFLAATQAPGGFNKLFVLKVLQESLARDEQFLVMFRDEARLAARLNHPNVVQTYEVGQAAGLHYLAMEYLEGQSLQRVSERFSGRGGLSPSMALRVAIDMLGGLHYAHELVDFDGTPLGVVHRDITPQNVFLTYQGQVKLVDFGIAKAFDSTSETRIGTVKGKVAYMAPEQARGERVDRRADLFSVGVVLWELLSGRRLWEGLTDIAVIGRLVQGDVPDLQALRPDLPPGVCRVCMRALSPEPENRPQSAVEFRQQLEAQLEQLSVRVDARRIGELVADAFAREREQVAQVIQKQLQRLNREAVPRLAPQPTLLPHAGDMPILGEGSDVHDAVTALHTPTSLRTAETSMPTALPPQLGTSSWRHFPWVVAASVGLAGLWVGVARPWESGEAAAADGEQSTSSPSDGESARSRAASHSTPSVGGCDAKDKPLVELTGEISEDAELTCDKEYLLRFTTYVSPGATLTIEPGTVLRGDLDTHGTLVVQPGGRIEASGTPERPIVFTSAAPPGQRKPGDWGGVIILGEAPINLHDASGRSETGKIEGITKGGDYGGSDPNDSSGTLRYVRIEYSGTEIAPNNEINGLTLGGVGRGTRLDHVQVRHTADDCFEFFGGTVDGKYLLCQHPGDDGFDWDYGYQGRLQFLVVQSAPSVQGDSNGFEGDNDPNGSSNPPISSPQIYNATLCGKNRRMPEEHYGLLLRRGTRATVRNTLVLGFGAALDVRDERTRPNIASSIFYGNTEHNLAYPETSKKARQRDERPFVDDDAGFDEAGYLRVKGLRNEETDPHLGGCFERLEPDFKPEAALVRNASTPPDDGFFDASARYIGAFRDRGDTWDAGGWIVWAK